MPIQEDLRECVIYLCVDVESDTGAIKRNPAGTAFFVLVKDTLDFGYLVTARHVIDASRKYGAIYVRINKADGSGYDDIRTKHDDWCLHDKTDVACLRVVGFPMARYRYVPTELFVSRNMIVDKSVGPGDEVLFVGLFSQHPGLLKNQPIVRVGHIALMPHEPIKVKLRKDSETQSEIQAYLVEAQSWGGQSGSPAFLYLAIDRRSGVITVGPIPRIFLLGLVHGHFTEAEDVEFVGDLKTYGSGKVNVNLGMAIVIPSEDILDLLMRDDLKEERRDFVAKNINP